MVSTHQPAKAPLRIGDHRVAAVGLLFVLLGFFAGGYRAVSEYQVPGPFSFEESGYCDFHNGLYFPTRAILDGVSPYGETYAQADEYPVDRQIPLFSPAFLAIHAPFAMLPLRISEVVFFVFSVVVALAIGYVSADMAGYRNRIDVILGITGALVMSRGGHTTIQDGYFTFEIVLATLLAIHWGRNRPWLAGVALLFVSAKPTYVIPLGFLLLARGNVKALVIGAVFSIVGAAIPFAWLSYNVGDGDLAAGFSQIIADIQGSQTKHLSEHAESPINTWTRLDLLAVIAKWMKADPNQTIHLVSMMAILAAPMLVLVKRLRLGIDDDAGGVTGLIILSAFLVSIYHHSYDALVLIAPLAGIVAGGIPSWSTRTIWVRVGLAALIIFPLFNYFSTRMILNQFEPGPGMIDVVTSVSGVLLALLLVLACWIGWFDEGHESGESSHLV